MNKFRSLVFAVSLICLTSLSSALAQDELADAWRVYQESRAILSDSFSQIENSWNLVDAGWVELDSIWVRWNYSWGVNEEEWVKIDNERALIASELGISIYDESPRLVRSNFPRTVSRTVYGRESLPWTSAASSGSWDDLAYAWTTLDAAWAVGNAQWAKLNRAWPELKVAHDEASVTWLIISRAWGQARGAVYANEDARRGDYVFGRYRYGGFYGDLSTPLGNETVSLVR